MDNSTEQKYIRTLKKASDKIKELLAEVNALKEKEPVAVIGMGCRFPGGANDPEKFWNILEQGLDTIREIPEDRWDIEQYYDPDPEKPGKTYARYGGFSDEADKFDAGFFGISPPEAESLDPQQRLLMEVSWEASESAGLDMSRLKGSKTGVFIGMCSSDYAQAHIASGDPKKIDEYSATGVAFSTAAGRLSYLYDFRGPGMVLDTACSSSLAALHLAAQSLQNRESDMAIAGGVSLILTPEPYIAFSKLKALAEDGRCRTFDDAASGYSKGEGCGLVILKRLSDAIRDKDNILAIIKGSAVNQDGESSGLTAPNALSQKEVISKALENAKISPDDVSYIEAHGTGTRLGDPIEARALGMVFGQRAGQKVPVGSVKTNIGHLEGAAGIASIIKVILALQHEHIPPSLHFNTPSVHIPWNELPIEVCAKLTPWKTSETPRIAGISSFGFSGTNAHLILQEAPKPSSDSQEEFKRGTYLLPLSAKDESALKEMTDRYRKYLSEYTHPFPLSRGDYLNDLCYTAAVGRTHFRHRTAIIGTSREEILKRLSEEILIKKPNHTGIVFLFTGQGAQYPGMAKKLYDTEPVFAKALNQCAEILKKHDVSLMNLLYGAESSPEIVNQTAHTQPLLFAIEYALSELWRSWGVKPAALIGHSIGEYAAACVAGVFSLEDGLKLAAIRGKLLQSLPKGGVMAAFFDNEQNIYEIIGNRNISIAAVNSPKNVVISGHESDIREVLAIFSSRKIHHALLQVSHAFHSHLTEPILKQFHKVISGIRLSEPVLPLISNLSGKEVEASEITKPEYWCRHLRQTVQFYDGMKTLADQGFELFLEIGPHAVLSGLGKQCSDGKGIWLPSLIRGEDDSRQMLKAVAQLYQYGISIDWQGVYASSPGKKIILPSYPFQRKRYWKNPVREICQETTITQKSEHPILRGASPSGADMNRKNNIIAELQRIIQGISGIESPDIHLNLFKMGLSSIMLTRLRQSVENDFNVEIQMSQFYEDADTMDKLASYIDRLMTPEDTMQNAKCKMQNEDTLHSSLCTLNSSVQAGIESIMREQIQAMSKLMSQQLEVLKAHPIADTTTAPALPKSAAPAVLPKEDNRHKKADVRPIKPQRAADVRITPIKDDLSVQQEKFIREFSERYTRRTRKSKELIDKYRPVLSDWINTLGFRMSLKEIMYPITAHCSQGARLWDIDGNEYIDMAIGYGVNYFGNNAPFVVEAVEKQLKDGFHLGPQFDLTTEVAQLICELTGVDRVTFCNSGTEAVMAALRVARTVTGRSKIVLFQGSYHGTFDGVLAIPTEHGSFPASPGTPPKMVEDVYVLKYGDPESLEFIKAHGRQLAAVLTEPVQSRNPSLQPKEFLHQLREITYHSKTALIFDEVITGFRIRQGGAQAFYNIQADIVTYGKVIGGGMPVGVISGKSRFMDAIDGGMWKYGDSSFPAKDVTVFGGTFCKHPLTMVASLAVLKHLKAEGPALQERVNALTAYFAETVNAYFEKEDVSLRVRYCASFFKFDAFGEYDPAIQPITTDLMFYLLMEKGVYTWERRICFFSTTHTREDLDKIIRAIKESVEEIRNNGFPFTAVQNAKCKMQNEHTLNFERCTFNCSSEQRRLYILSQLEGGELPYHLPGGTIIEGKPDIHRMNRAFKEIIRRHEILRTGFEISGNEIVQRVHERVEFEVTIREGRESDIDTIAQAFIQPFDLSKPPLMRVCLVQFFENRCLLLMDVHHIAADGISANIMIQEFLKLYQGQLLPPLSAQYRDYVAWQENYLKSERLKQHEAFWLNQFSDEIPVLNLPTDFPRPARQQFDGDYVYFSTDVETTEALKALSKKTGVSMFMLTLAACYVLLHKLSSQEDMVISVAADGRVQKAFETTVGMFVNTLPIRQKPMGSVSFSEFLSRMKKELLSIYDHQEYPFELLVQKLKLSGAMSRNVLSDIIFNFENADDRVFSIEGLRFSPYDFKPKAAMADLSLDIIETSDSLNIWMEYCSKLFKRETVERWAVYYQNILKEIITNPNTPLSDIDILPESEKYLILEQFNDTRADYPRSETLVSLFEKQVGKTPDNLALIFRNTRLTYKELNERANQVAHVLKSRFGIQGDDPVGIMLERSELMMIGIFGILKAGGAYVPISPEYPADRIRYMLEDSDCKVLLTQEKFSHLVSSDSGKPSIIDISAIRNEKTGNPESGISARNLAYIIYTSGSTGQPKGVMIEHGSVINQIHCVYKKYPIRKEDIILQNAPFIFDASVWEFFGGLCYGVPLYLLEPGGEKEPAAIINTIHENKVTTVDFVPSMLNAFLDYLEQSKESWKMSCLKYVSVGGEALTAALVNKFNTLLGKPCNILFYNTYGPTEATVFVSCFNCPKDGDLPVVPIGKPIDNTQLYILDKAMKHPVPIGAVGEICIGGIALARGYVNNPELTAEKFISHPFKKNERIYKTGDLGRWQSDGNIEYLGRTDHQVKIRGNRIELGEIENALLRYPGIREAMVLAKETESGKELAAYFVSGGKIIISDVKAELKKSLPDYMIPAYFTALNKFPLNPNGKIDRKALPNPLESNAQMRLGSEYAAPRNEIERISAAIWEEVLGRKNIGIHDDFFALGGDSIKAIQVALRLNAKNLRTQVRLIFQYPTIAELGQSLKVEAVPVKEAAEELRTVIDVKKQREILSNAGIDAADFKDIYPLSPAQEGMLFHYLYQKETTAYVEQCSFQIHGTLDINAFEESWNELVRRYDVLRSTFVYKHTERPMQIVLKDRKIGFKTENISSLSKEAQSSHIRSFKEQDIRSGFDLGKDMLMRIMVFEMGEDSYEAVWTNHHILIDGWCLGILIRELFAAYQSLRKNSKPVFAPAIPYSRYISWLESQDKEAAARYWREYLSGYDSPVSLPRNGSKDAPSKIEIIALEAEESLTRALEKIAAQARVTVNVILQSLWGVLLGAYNNTSDAVFGAAVSGRPAEFAGIEQMVGLFLNTVPVRIRTESHQPFTELIRNRQRDYLESEPFHYASLANIQMLTPLKNDLLNHVMVFENYPFAQELADIVKQYDLGFSIGNVGDFEHTNYDLSLEIYHGKKIVIEFNYDISVYSEAQMTKVRDDLSRLLDAVSAAPEITIGKLRTLLLSQEEKSEQDRFVSSVMQISEEF